MMGIMSIFVVAIIVFVIVGMLAHSIAFGSVVWLIARKASDAVELQRPKPCAFCGSTLLPEAVVCGACGAPRDPKHVAVDTTSENSSPSIPAKRT